MRSWRSFAGLLAVVLAVSGCASSIVAQEPVSASREDFLQRLDAALAGRDPRQLASLADAGAWREAGRPALDRLTLALPSAPLKRVRDLSTNEVLYEDGEGKTWRARLREGAGGPAWSVVALNRACPPKSMPRGRPWEDLPPTPSSASSAAAGASETWTLLECWPLPR